MAAEIERKFVLEQPPPWLQDCDSVEIEQGYLAVNGAVEVRLRRAGGQRGLTVKHGDGVVREEVELGLDAAQIEALWPACGERRLRKRRYLVPLEDGLRAEVDVYDGDLEGLAVVEVEFPDWRQAERFQPPDWFGREVSGEGRYANRTLAVEGGPESRPEPGQAPASKRPAPGRAYRLRRREPTGEGLRRIAAGRAAKALQRLRGSAPGEDGFAEAVHGARKDMKKLRAVVRLLREPLGKQAHRRENRAFRDAARALSESRDAQVKLETLEALAERFEELPGDAVSLWRGELKRELREQAGDGARLAEAIELIEAGAGRIARWQLDRGSWGLLDAGVTRAYRDGRGAMRRARRNPTAASFHEWRKRAKDLWYQLEILRDAWPPVLGETAAEAHRLSELLGDHHDLALLDEDLSERVIEAGRAAALREAIATRQRDLAAQALALGARLYAERPKAYRRRLRGYWRAWRE